MRIANGYCFSAEPIAATPVTGRRYCSSLSIVALAALARTTGKLAVGLGCYAVNNKKKLGRGDLAKVFARR